MEINIVSNGFKNMVWLMRLYSLFQF